MRTYTQLTREERYQIYMLMQAGHKQSEIAGTGAQNRSPGGSWLSKVFVSAMSTSTSTSMRTNVQEVICTVIFVVRRSDGSATESTTVAV